jgi:hypothetical protein
MAFPITYTAVAGGHMAEDIAEPVQVENGIAYRVLNQGGRPRLLHNGQQGLRLQLTDLLHRSLQLTNGKIRQKLMNQGCKMGNYATTPPKKPGW